MNGRKNHRDRGDIKIITTVKTCDKLRQSIRQSVITRVVFFLQNAVSSLDIISL